MQHEEDAEKSDRENLPCRYRYTYTTTAKTHPLSAPELARTSCRGKWDIFHERVKLSPFAKKVEEEGEALTSEKFQVDEQQCSGNTTKGAANQM